MKGSDQSEGSDGSDGQKVQKGLNSQIGQKGQGMVFVEGLGLIRFDSANKIMVKVRRSGFSVGWFLSS